MREEPSLKKEQVVAIFRQITSIFTEHNLEQIMFKFHSPNEIHKCIYTNRSGINYYNVFYILLSHALSKEVPISSVLAEFLNPIYYNIGDEAKQKQLFDFIDKIFSFCIDKKDRDNWRVEASKYITSIAMRKNTAHTEIELKRESVIYGDIIMPIERGHKKIFSELYAAGQIYKGEKMTKRGKGVELSVLQQLGSYENEASFRGALNKLRAKLIEHKLPIIIVNESTKHYMMEIRYP